MQILKIPKSRGYVIYMPKSPEFGWGYVIEGEHYSQYGGTEHTFTKSLIFLKRVFVDQTDVK